MRGHQSLPVDAGVLAPAGLGAAEVGQIRKPAPQAGSPVGHAAGHASGQAAVGSREHETRLSGSPISAAEQEAIGSIVSDVEEFARGWIGRLRRLIHRSSQLIERESLLAGAIARLDQQKAEWNKRTAAKEAGLRDQSKRLTEAWLEVEAERRKAIQGARAAASASTKPGGGPIVATPIAPATGTPVTGVPHPIAAAANTNVPVAAPAPIAATQNCPADATAVATKANALPQPAPQAGKLAGGHHSGGPVPANHVAAGDNSANQMPAAPPQVNVNVPVGGSVPASAPMPPMAITPIPPGGNTSTGEIPGEDEAFQQAEAATRQKIEEFKRMQRAIRSNRHK